MNRQLLLLPFFATSCFGSVADSGSASPDTRSQRESTIADTKLRERNRRPSPPVLDNSLARPATAGPALVANPEARAVERSFLMVNGQKLALHLPKDGEAPIPSVLVFHSAMGRTESVLEWCDRLAEGGFAAIALDFYDGRTADSPEEARVLRDSANERSATLKGVVQQAWEQMQTDARLRSSKRFLLGWSFGGAWATYSSGFLSGTTGVVAFYGQAFTDDPHLYNALHAPLLFIGGKNDTAPTPSKLQAIVKRLESNGKTADLLLVRAGHGFAERSHPGHDSEAAEIAWESVIRFLEVNTF